MNETKTVLIVDDEPDILKVTEFRVRKAGYRTVTAVNGQLALEAARKERPDLILLDYKMPGMTGMEVYAELRDDSLLGGIPVIFLTASSQNDELMRRMQEVGAVNKIIKPYEPGDLLGKIKELIG